MNAAFDMIQVKYSIRIEMATFAQHYRAFEESKAFLATEEIVTYIRKNFIYTCLGSSVFLSQLNIGGVSNVHEGCSSALVNFLKKIAQRIWSTYDYHHKP